MNVLHVVNRKQKEYKELDFLVNIQKKNFNYEVSVVSDKKALFVILIKRLLGKPFDVIHLHCESDLLKKFSRQVVLEDLDGLISKKTFHADLEFQLFINKEILFHVTDSFKKVLPILIESLKYLPADYTLRILCNLSENDLVSFRELLSNLNLQHRVSFVVKEEVSDVQLARAYKDSRLCVLNIINPESEINIIKSLACGIPTLVFSKNRSLNIKGLMYLEFLGPKALARGIKDIIENDNSVDLEYVYETFSIEAFADYLHKKYQALG